MTGIEQAGMVAMTDTPSPQDHSQLKPSCRVAHVHPSQRSRSAFQIAGQHNELTFIDHSGKKRIHDDTGEFLSLDAIALNRSASAFVVKNLPHHGDRGLANWFIKGGHGFPSRWGESTIIFQTSVARRMAGDVSFYAFIGRIDTDFVRLRRPARTPSPEVTAASPVVRVFVGTALWGQSVALRFAPPNLGHRSRILFRLHAKDFAPRAIPKAHPIFKPLAELFFRHAQRLTQKLHLARRWHAPSPSPAQKMRVTDAQVEAAKRALVKYSDFMPVDEAIRDMIAAAVQPPADHVEPCPVCGNEERGQGGYLSCECPASPTRQNGGQQVGREER